MRMRHKLYVEAQPGISTIPSQQLAKETELFRIDDDEEDPPQLWDDIEVEYNQLSPAAFSAPPDKLSPVGEPADERAQVAQDQVHSDPLDDPYGPSQTEDEEHSARNLSSRSCAASAVPLPSSTRSMRFIATGGRGLADKC